MPLQAPDPTLFSMANILADAIALSNMVLDYWMVIIGLGLGTAIMVMIFKQLKRSLP